jgi:hypothetical protein
MEDKNDGKLIQKDLSFSLIGIACTSTAEII